MVLLHSNLQVQAPTQINNGFYTRLALHTATENPPDIVDKGTLASQSLCVSTEVAGTSFADLVGSGFHGLRSVSPCKLASLVMDLF